MTKIIAEIGWNHMGNLDLAQKMILASKENGADFVKFQTWSLSRLVKGPWDKDGRKEIYEKAELSFDDHIKIKKYCDSLDIQFFSSVFSIPDAEMLAQVQSNHVKIASFESRNIPLLQTCDNLFDTIFISTGTSTIYEIKKSLSHMHKSKIVLLHCVSSYPLLYENANLPQITRLKKIADIVGYSDHTEGIAGAKVALEYDVQFIEKHFTTDHNLPGRDNKFAILPHELKELREYINIRNQMNIDHGDVVLDCESDARKVMPGRFNG